MLLTKYNEEKVMQQLRREYMEEGLQQGLQQGIAVLIETCRELEQSKETAAKKVCQKYKLTQEEAEELVERYW